MLLISTTLRQAAQPLGNGRSKGQKNENNSHVHRPHPKSLLLQAKPFVVKQAQVDAELKRANLQLVPKWHWGIRLVWAVLGRKVTSQVRRSNPRPQKVLPRVDAHASVLH